jgi:hypothetical protein
MIDERLGLAAGAVLREQDRPPADPRGSIGRVMAEVRVTRQAKPSRTLPFFRRHTVPVGGLQAVSPLDDLAHHTNGRTPRPAPAAIGGSRTMLTASKLMVATIGVALVGTLLASGVLTPSGSGVPGAASPGSPGTPGVAWTTERVSLTADDLRLEVDDLVFGEDVWPTSVDSDPGDSSRWTLEIVWTEHDVEQRLNMYFEADDTDWWVREIRTYDGQEPGDWVTANGPFFKTPLGEAFEGDVTIDLEGRPAPSLELVPAVLTFAGLRLAVHPGTGEAPVSEVTEEAVPELSPGPGDERYGPDEEYPSAEIATLDRALFAAIGDPQAGAVCLTVEEAHAVAADVLTDLGMTGWSVETATDVRDDGCAVAHVRADDQRIKVMTGTSPEVMDVLASFLGLSLDQCLDETSAVEMLTEQLDAIGHTDYVIKVGRMLAGPSGQLDEIRAHAEAGCVFYVGSGAEADGTAIYHLHGG